jgi:hypothetical protein
LKVQPISVVLPCKEEIHVFASPPDKGFYLCKT